MKNPFSLLQKFLKQPTSVPPKALAEPKALTDEDLKLLKQIGASQEQLFSSMQYSFQINFERTAIYREIDRAVLHWMMGAATELFAEQATDFNQLQRASVWVTGDEKYIDVLTKFLNDMGVEEKIFDWAWTTAAYGDIFVKMNGEPGLGVVSIEDSEHPSSISRVDYKGVLVGFYRTPLESGGYASATGTNPLLPPWEYSHFRLLGAKTKKPIYSDPTFTEYRTVHLMGPETRQVTTRYGSSLLLNGLPIYKRLRLAEDSILLARLTRGILKYLYKIKVTDQNVEAAGEIVNEYMTILKRARAIDTSVSGTGSYDSKANPMCLVGDTMVTLHDGESISIFNLLRSEMSYIGKYIQSKNPLTLESEPVKIVSIQKTRRNADLVRVYLSNHDSVECTPDHRFMLSDGTYREARTLSSNEKLMSVSGQNVEVVIIKYLSKREDTYDITVERNHNFSLSAGIFVHNSSVEDLFIPVFGDVGDVTVEELGGKTDIRWIVDIEDLRNQLASALRTPLSLLGGFVQEASGQLGSEAISELDIRFARSARRLQRALISGITRMCQVHLAYMNMDPDPNLFQVNMSETSTAEEEIIKNNLDTGLDVVDKFMGVVEKLDPQNEIDKFELFNYFNQKFLKLNDLDLKSFRTLKPEQTETPLPGSLKPEEPEEEFDKNFGEVEEPVVGGVGESKARIIREFVEQMNEREQRKIAQRGNPLQVADYIAHLPLPENTSSALFESGSTWIKQYEETMIEVTKVENTEKHDKKKDNKKK